jgi:hypothetical protein
VIGLPPVALGGFHVRWFVLAEIATEIALTHEFTNRANAKYRAGQLTYEERPSQDTAPDAANVRQSFMYICRTTAGGQRAAEVGSEYQRGGLPSLIGREPLAGLGLQQGA